MYCIIEAIPGVDWKQPKQLKCAYTQPIAHTNKKLSSLIAL